MRYWMHVQIMRYWLRTYLDNAISDARLDNAILGAPKKKLLFSMSDAIIMCATFS